MTTHPAMKGACFLLLGFVALALALSPPVSAQDDSWTALSNMPTAREASSACAIAGKIHVIGGAAESAAVDANEVYDPATDSWASLSPIPVASARASANAVDGKCYVIGGQSRIAPPSPAFDDVQVFDPSSDSWSMGAPMPTALFGHASAAWGGKIYVVGGKTTLADDGTGLVLVYDTDTDTWSQTTSMPSWSGLLAASQVNGTVYAMGGSVDPGSDWKDDVDSYDPATETWTSKAPMPTSRYGLTSSAVSQRIYAIGGARAGATVSTIEQYDPASDDWLAMSSAPTERSNASSATVGGKIYVFGGTQEFFFPHTAINTVEAYAPPGVFHFNAGLNGNWWNGPERNGEGVQIEIADAGDGNLVFVATVYSYDTMGNQIFLVAVGPVDGDTAEVDVFITEGGVWGDGFDPALVNESQWGTGTFTASSCGAIHMELRPNQAFRNLGYTNLAYGLIRLTTPLIPCPA